VSHTEIPPTPQAPADRPEKPAEQQYVPPEIAPFSWRPVTLAAVLLAVILLITSSKYGYSGDQLYFIASGKQVAKSYVDQSFMVPLLAHTLDSIAPGSQLVPRIPATLVASGAVYFCALTAREMGGLRRAQIVSAAACAMSPLIVIFSHLMITPVLDIFYWTLLSWLLARWVRLRADRILLWVAVVAALALQNNFLVGVYLAALVLGLAMAGPRRLLLRPLVWGAGVLALATAGAYLVTHLQHGWGAAQSVSAVGDVSDIYNGSPLMVIPLTLLPFSIPLIMLLFGGLGRLLGMPELREYKFFGWAALLTLLFFLAAPGRTYYIAALFPVLWAAGSVSLQFRPRNRVRDWRFSRTAFAAYHAFPPDGRGQG
jgi:hypothetical protein